MESIIPAQMVCVALSNPSEKKTAENTVGAAESITVKPVLLTDFKVGRVRSGQRE